MLCQNPCQIIPHVFYSLLESAYLRDKNFSTTNPSSYSCHLTPFLMCTVLTFIGDKWDENELIYILLNCQLDFFDQININNPPCSNPSLTDRISLLAWDNELRDPFARGFALERRREKRKCKNFGNIRAKYFV
jgi:hypothetical protein